MKQGTFCKFSKNAKWQNLWYFLRFFCVRGPACFWYVLRGRCLVDRWASLLTRQLIAAPAKKAHVPEVLLEVDACFLEKNNFNFVSLVRLISKKRNTQNIFRIKMFTKTWKCFKFLNFQKMQNDKICDIFYVFFVLEVLHAFGTCSAAAVWWIGECLFSPGS